MVPENFEKLNWNQVHPFYARFPDRKSSCVKTFLLLSTHVRYHRGLINLAMRVL